MMWLSQSHGVEETDQTCSVVQKEEGGLDNQCTQVTLWEQKYKLLPPWEGGIGDILVHGKWNLVINGLKSSLTGMMI